MMPDFDNIIEADFLALLSGIAFAETQADANRFVAEAVKMFDALRRERDMWKERSSIGY